MQWYYSKNGTQVGPVDQSEILSKLATGEISQADLVWRDGMPDWIPAAQVSELKPLGSAFEQPKPVTSVEPSDPYVTPVTNPVPGPVSYAPVVPIQGTGKATASMVLGIVSLVFGICGCYGLVIAVPCGILAILFGGQFKAAAAVNPALNPELGKVKAGIIMGWIGIGISVLFTVLFISLGIAAQAMNKIH